MSLPSAEQRVLDGIAESLRVSEPRLAGMYDTFTRLTAGEPPPWREELAATAPLARVAALFDRMHGSPRTGRRPWQKALAICEVAIVLVVLVVIVGLTTGPATVCRLPRHSHAAASSGQRCPRQADAVGYLPGW